MPFDDDELAEVFFNRPPERPALEPESWEPKALAPAQRRAMTATAAMLGFFLVVSVCFAAYAELALVKPATLGKATLPALPSAAPPHASALRPPEQTSSHPAGVTGEPAQPTPAPIARAQEATRTAALVPAPVARAHETSRAAAPTLPPARREHALASAARAPREHGSPAAVQTERAYRALHAGRAREAGQLAAQAVRLDPMRASAYIALAGARDALGDHGGARMAFRDCVRHATDKLVSACQTLAR